MRPLAGREVVIVEAVRTPIGRGDPENGYYRDIHPAALLAHTLKRVIERAGINAEVVDQVIAGCARQIGEQAQNIARNSWLQAGLPISAAATTIDTQCGSAQQAFNLSASLIATGACDVAVACGVEHMGHLPIGAGAKVADVLGTAMTSDLFERHPLVHQGISAEMMAERWGIPREELDELALRSHRLAHRATIEGRFHRETAPLVIDGVERVADQGIRPDTSLQRLAALPPAFKPGGRITAGNSSQVSDGAAAVLLMAADCARQAGLRPRARVFDQTAVGVDPVLMLTGPIHVTRRLLERGGLTIDDIDRFEINEAFASVVAAWTRELGPDPDGVNVNGGAIALGHPLGSTGARLVTTLLHELERADLELGLVAMCCGGGIGTGTLIQRL